MRAITLWEPWASLVAIGAKTYETRSWSTSYRGPLLIHAAARPPRPVDGLGFPHTDSMGTMWVLTEAWPDPVDGSNLHAFPVRRGVVVAVANIADVIPTESVPPDDLERQGRFGDYTPGRFAWRLEDIRELEEPVPARGRQGLWVPSNDLVSACAA